MEMPFKICKHFIPGKCMAKRCTKKPRDLKTRPKSHQLCGRHAKQLWRLQNPLHAAFDNLRSSARKRKIPFNLTLEQFREFTNNTDYVEGKGRRPNALQIDRINPNLGYSPENIQILTTSANVSKGNKERHTNYEPDPF